MEKLKKFLEELGFGKSEVEVYSALVGMKEASVVQISKKSGLHRANIYDALESLIKRGLVFVVEDPVKKYYARSPKSLLSFIKRKEVEFNGILEDIERRGIANSEGKIGKTEGRLAIVEAVLGLLGEGEDILAYGLNDEIHKVLGFSEDDFHKKRIEKKIGMKLIYNVDSVEAKKKGGDLLEVRFLPRRYDSCVTTFICGKKMVIINNCDSSRRVDEIEDDMITRAYAGYFDVLWKKAKAGS